LDKPLGLYCGWFGLASLSTETLKLQKTDLIGYPVDKEENNMACSYTSIGKIDHIENDYLEYSMEATSG